MTRPGKMLPTLTAILVAIAVFAAVVPAATSGKEPAPASQEPRPEPRVYSLVAARQVRFHAMRENDCVRVSFNDIRCPRYPAIQLALARSLAGPPVAADMYPPTEVQPHAAWGEPVLLVMLWGSADEGDRVVAAAVADRAGRACIPGADLDRLGWHPTGPGLAEIDRGICTDLSPLIAIWAPDEAVTVSALNGRPLHPVRASLIVGRISSQGRPDLSPCPAGERCFRWVVDTRMTDVQTLSGATVPASVMVTLTQDSGPPDTERILMIVKRARDGRWIGYWTWPAASPGQETCYRTYQTAGFTLYRPRRARVRGGRTCLVL